MTKEEWVTEFQVLNGRVPTQEEFLLAKQENFQTVSHVKKRRVDAFLLLKIALVLVVAIFGYVVGYLFA